MGEDIFKEAHFISSENTSSSLKIKFPGIKVYLIETVFKENFKMEYCSKLVQLGLDMFNLDSLVTDHFDLLFQNFSLCVFLHFVYYENN